MTSVGSTLELLWSFWIQHRACKVAKALWFCWRHQCEHVDSSYSSLLFVQKLAVSWWQYHHMSRSLNKDLHVLSTLCSRKQRSQNATSSLCGSTVQCWDMLRFLLCFFIRSFSLFCMSVHYVSWFLSPYALHCFVLLCIALHCFALLCFALLCIALHCFALLCCALLYKLSCASSYLPHVPCTCFSVVKSSQASRLVRKEQGFGLILVGLVCYILYHWCELSQAVHAASFFPQPLRSVFGVRPEMGIDTKWQRQVKWVFRWMFLGNGRILQLIIFFFGKRTPEHRDQYGCRTAK